MPKHHLLSAVAAAAIVAFALPATGSAQDTTRAKADTAAAKPAKPQQQTSTGDVAIKPDFAAVIAALDGAAASAAKISALTDVPADRVRIVDVQSLGQEQDAAALTASLEKNKDGVTALQAALDGNAAIKTALSAKSLSSADIIAADVAADGAVTLYSNKK